MLNARAPGQFGKSPSAAESASAARAPTPAGADLATLARGLVGLMGRAQALCRLRRVSPSIQLVEHEKPDGAKRLVVQGVHTCKSPLCPLCAPKYQRTRSAEISEAIDRWGARRVVFATYTVRHHKAMPLSLLHKLLTHAHGSLFSGRSGQQLADDLGGKPETVRAHDRTWSVERGWHPHLHCLAFLHSEAKTESELTTLLAERWHECVLLSLRRMHKLCARVLAQPQTAHLREIFVRCFGKRLCPDAQNERDVARRLQPFLARMTSLAVLPNEHGVRVEYVRRPDRTPSYLAKMGLELAWSIGKLEGSRKGDGLVHYGLWQVAQLCTKHHDPRRKFARRAWSQLFEATFGTATITFSSRERLQLGADPYADGDEPPELQAGETTRLVGSIEGETWESLRKSHRHGLLVTLHVAHALGLVAELPWVDREDGLHSIPATREPREREPRPEWWQTLTRLVAAEKSGRERTRNALARCESREALDAWSELPDASRREWLEEVRYRLHEQGAIR